MPAQTALLLTYFATMLVVKNKLAMLGGCTNSESLLSFESLCYSSKTPAQASAPVDANDLDTPLKSVLNFRDVGEFVNRASGSKSVHLQPQVA